jgi:ATP-dependent exoDNAse (exonuclease V) alpha subunit
VNQHFTFQNKEQLISPNKEQNIQALYVVLVDRWRILDINMKTTTTTRAALTIFTIAAAIVAVIGMVALSTEAFAATGGICGHSCGEEFHLK